MHWTILALAIVCEVVATLALKESNGFTRLGYSLTVVIGYALAFYGLSHVIKILPVGVVYAIWSGVGIALVTLAGVVLFKQKLDVFGYLGIVLIVLGVAVLKFCSKSIDVSSLH